MLKESSTEVKEELLNPINRCLIDADIPEDWANAIVLLIYTTGDSEHIENYRSISLLAQEYNLLMRIVSNSFSTVEHLHTTVKLMTLKTTEYNIPLWMGFLDFRKVFDTVELWAIVKSLRNARYIDLITRILERNTQCCKVTRYNDENQNIERDVRQGGIISTKRFVLVLEDAFKQLR